MLTIGINIRANRLFGPQPKATTYFCLWELSLSRVSAFLSPEFTNTLAAVGRAVGYNYPDHDNAPASIYIEKTPPDATFVKLSVKQVSALLSYGNSGIAVELPDGLFLDASTMASKSCRSVMGLGIPNISVHIISRKSEGKRWQPIGSVATGLSLDNFKLPHDWTKVAEDQKVFLKAQDAPTRRVPYLYDEPASHSLGHYYHDVFVPNPQEITIPWADSDSVTSVEEPVFEDSSDSTSESDSTTMSVPLSRISRKKRAMSVANMQTALERYNRQESVGDESDSGSTVSTSSSLSSFDGRRPLGTSEDMAVILEDRLKSFKRIHLRAKRLFSRPMTSPPPVDEDSSGTSFVPLAIVEGAIYQIRLFKTTVELNTDTLHSAVDVSGAISACDIRPELLLDQLVAHQVSSVSNDHKMRTPMLFDIAMPSFNLRLVQGSFSKPESVIDAVIGSPSVRVLQKPKQHSIENGLAATVDLRTLEVTLSRRETTARALSLLDVPGFEAPPRQSKVLPFVRITSAELGGAFSQAGLEKTIQLKAKALSLQSATPGIPIISYMIDLWRPIFSSLPKHKTQRTAADVVYDTLNYAIEDGLLMSLPAFMYESPYALQFNDQRSIRHDVGWFTLARLRHWMSLLTDKPRQVHPASSEEKTKTLVAELAQLDAAAGVTKEVVVAQPYLRKALGQRLDRAGLTPESRMNSAVNLFVNIESTAVRHYGRMLHTGAVASSAVTVDSVAVANERSRTWHGDVPSTNVRSVVTVKRLALDLHDSFLTAVQAILTHIDNHREEIRELPVVKAVDHASIVVIDVNVSDLAAGITGGGLRLDLAIVGAQGSGTVKRSRRTGRGNSAHCLEINSSLVNCQSVQAILKEAHESTVPEELERDLIVSTIRSIRCSADSTIDSANAKGGSARLLLGVEAFEFDSRPQLKAFFDFAQDWRKDHFPLYKPTIEQVQDIMAKRKAYACTRPEPVPDRRTVMKSMIVDLYLGSVRMQARAAKGLWLGWDMGKVYASRRGSNHELEFGLRLEPQVVGAYTSAKRIKTKDASVIRLPSVTITGTHSVANERKALNAIVNLGMFTGIIKPTVLDRLLSLHQRLGNDVLAVVREYRGRGENASAESLPEVKAAVKPLLFSIQASIAGVRVGLKADNVPTTLMFEALEMKGFASNVETSTLQWSAKANHVGLSLIRMAEGPSYQTAAPLRGSRSVSMVFDISAEEIPGTQTNPSKLNVKFTRVHTVMHVAALNELGDLIRSWSADIALLREVHAEEVAEVKEQTSKVLKKLDASVSSAKVDSISSGSEGAASIETWFAQRLLTFEVAGIGIAIPLDAEASIDVTQTSLGASAALLFSIRSMSLTTSRTETARFRVQQTALQFVDRFDPTVHEHFQGQLHTSNNYMVLPSINSEAQMSSTPESITVTAHCSATDFKLALTPEITDGIARLSDLYEHGKEHLSAMERDYKAEWSKYAENADTVAARYEASSRSASRQHLVVRVSFRFDSGVVELHRPSAAPGRQFTTPSTNKKGGRRPVDFQRDRVTLPTVSVWMDYSGASSSDDDKTHSLLFNMAVHESRNVVHPTVLPFFVEIVQRCEQRAKSRPQSLALPPPPLEPVAEVPEESQSQPMAEKAIERITESGKLRLRFTLRIDRSELRLSCAPDSNAYLDLKWESGGFVASTLLGGQDNTTLAGSVSGVTAYLSHEFAEQGRGCVEAGAKDMAFSLALCTTDGQRGLSIVVDTQVSVEFRLEAFSAWLIFMSVWVDNAPKFDIKKSPETPPPQQTISPLVSNKLSLAVLVRFRSIDFDANIAVSQARLEMSPIVLRTKSDGETTEVELTVGTTHVTAVGDISGDVRSENLKFSTIRRSSRASDDTDPHVLQMKIEAGDLRGNLFISDTNIVRFQLKPSIVTLTDNWKDVSATSRGHVYLDFIVDAGDFSGVLRLPAIPRLIGHFYALFDLAESQTRIATQRSEMFKLRQKRAQENQTPMTTVVLPMSREESAPDVHTAPRSHVKTAQMMRFALSGIDVGIFADDYQDGSVVDFYRFYIGNVSASLQRQENEIGLPERELELHVAFVEWQTTDGKRATRMEKHEMSSRELIDAAVTSGHREVAILPLMTLKMESTEHTEARTLEYDFDVTWGPTDGDIKILPNFFDAAFKSFKRLLSGVDEEQDARARRRGQVRTTSSARIRQDLDAGLDAPIEDPMPSLRFQRRGLGPFNNPVPKLRALGETTGEAAMMIPRIKRAMGELPAYSHRFVTLPLEDGMNLLLKLYERQLPDLA